MNSPETIRENKKFGYLLSIALIALAAIRMLMKYQDSWVLPGIGATLLLFTLLAPQLLTPVRRVWEKFGFVMGAINSYIILTVVFFLILTPLNLVMRMFGKDILKLKRNKQDTYWESASPQTKFGMKNQF